jgi:hypothetical protein
VKLLVAIRPAEEKSNQQMALLGTLELSPVVQLQLMDTAVSIARVTHQIPKWWPAKVNFLRPICPSPAPSLNKVPSAARTRCSTGFMRGRGGALLREDTDKAYHENT